MKCIMMDLLCGNIYYRLYSNDRNNKKLFGNYSTPSISVGGKSAAWHLEVIISALPRIRVRDSLPKIWPVTSPPRIAIEFGEGICYFWSKWMSQAKFSHFQEIDDDHVSQWGRTEC